MPEKPRVLGELKIPGYSAYLHPVGEDLLLGIGQDVNEEGRPQGTQLSLFDVSDLRKPTRLHSQPLGPGWSEAESDHHAFLYWPKTGLVVIPFEQRAVGYRVSRARGISAVGTIDHEVGEARLHARASGARSSSATPCSRSRTPASSRAASRRSPSWAGPRSRRPPSPSPSPSRSRRHAGL